MGKPTMVQSLASFNIIKMFQPLLETSHYIHPVTKKITQKTVGLDWTRNWIFTNPNPKMFCNLYQAIFNHANMVPSRCRECYKVVVKIPTIVALMRVWQFQQDFTKDLYGRDRFCKCGIEERPWVHYQYGAYFYNQGIEQGKLRHAQVMRELKDVFGKDRVSDTPGAVRDGKLEVILKRYCTEFEMNLGPSDKYEVPAGGLELEKKIMDAWDISKCNPGQPDYVIEHVLDNWMRFAWDRGDSSVMQFNDGKPLFPVVVTYHEQGPPTVQLNTEKGTDTK
jgi:hypothetical protein